MIPIRLYAYAAIALAIVGILWHDHYVTKRLNETRTALTQATKNIAIERANTEKANASSNSFQGRIRELEDQRTADGFGAIRVCRRPVVKLPASSAASGSYATPVPDDAGTVEVSTDVGPAADVYGTRCEANAIKLDELQKWVRGR